MTNEGTLVTLLIAAGGAGKSGSCSTWPSQTMVEAGASAVIGRDTRRTRLPIHVH